MQIFHEELIQVNQNYDSQEEYFRNISLQLSRRGYVKPSFLKALILRERSYPTGLQLDGPCVAIPHTDSVHVIQEFIHVTTLSKTVRFHRMDEPEEETDVAVIFLLGLTSGDRQIESLGKLMNLIQNIPTMKELIQAETGSQIMATLERYWDNG